MKGPNSSSTRSNNKWQSYPVVCNKDPEESETYLELQCCSKAIEQKLIKWQKGTEMTKAT